MATDSEGRLLRGHLGVDTAGTMGAAAKGGRMSEFTWRPCVYGEQWPELFAQLPDDRARHTISEVLADSRLEGKVHTREDVSDLIDVELGRITPAESIARGMQRFRVQRAATA